MFNSKQRSKAPVRIHAVFVAIFLIPMNSYWIMQMEAIHYSGHATLVALFFNTICSLLMLIFFNIPLRSFSPNLAFNRNELLTIYVMLNLSSGLVGHSMLQILPVSIAAPFGLATPENEWKELFSQHIPTWLAVHDERTLEEYIGVLKSESTLYKSRHLKAWFVPILVWSVFVFFLMSIMICINIIVQKQWTDREKLTYPIARLPFEMTAPSSKLFKNKLFLISFTVISLIGVINGFHFLFPSVPYLQIRPYDLSSLFTTKPWNEIGKIVLTVRPFLIGLIFLIPLDIIFSCWFFFFVWKLQLLVGSVIGMRQRAEFPTQTAGAYISVFCLSLWVGRHHLMRVLKVALYGVDDPDSEDTSPLKYRAALLGLIVGFVFIVLFCWKAGMSPLVAGIFFILYLIISIGITRIRAEVGSPIHDMHFAGPEYLMVDAIGTRALGPKNLSILSFFWFLTRAHYSDVMPHQLEGFHLADRTRMDGRVILIAMLISIVLGTIVAFWVILDATYKHNHVIMTWAGREPFNRLQMWLSYPSPTNFTGLGFFAYGLCFGLFLMIMRIRFLWWPFHPAGYAVSSTYGMRGLWSMFFVAWLVKWMILKHGGLKAHRRALPLFFGLILGEYAIGGFWALFGIIFKTPTYNFLKWW